MFARRFWCNFMSFMFVCGFAFGETALDVGKQLVLPGKESDKPLVQTDAKGQVNKEGKESLDTDADLAEVEKEIEQELGETAAADSAAAAQVDVGVTVESAESADEEAVPDQETSAEGEADIEVQKRTDIGVKKTLFIPGLNRAIALDAGEIIIPGFGRVIFESITDAEKEQVLLLGRPEKKIVEWGPVKIKDAEFTVNEGTKDFTFKASISFLKREMARATIESFSEDGLLRIKCELSKPILIPVSPWATFVVDAFYLEKDKTQAALRVYSHAILKQHPEVKIDLVFSKDLESGVVAEASLEHLPLSHIIAPLARTPLSKISLNKIKLRKEGMTSEEDDMPPGGVTMKGTANFGGLLSGLPIKIDDAAFSLVVGAQKAPITLTAKIPQNIEFIPSLLSVKDPTIVLQYSEIPSGEDVSQISLGSEQQGAVAVDDPGKKITMKLFGAVDLKLPVVGDFSAKLTSLFKLTGKEKGFSSFIGTLDKTIDYANRVVISKCQLVLARRVVADEGAEEDKTASAYKLAISGEGTVDAEDLAKGLPDLPGFNTGLTRRSQIAG